jgi:hypothetical protein
LKNFLSGSARGTCSARFRGTASIFPSRYRDLLRKCLAQNFDGDFSEQNRVCYNQVLKFLTVVNIETVEACKRRNEVIGSKKKKKK